jgi:hypothetical protein
MFSLTVGHAVTQKKKSWQEHHVKVKRIGLDGYSWNADFTDSFFLSYHVGKG